MAISSAPGDDHFYLSDCSPKDKPWDNHKAQAQKVASLYLNSDFFQSYGQRTRDCVQSLLFAFEAADEGEVSLRLQAARFCRVRHCPVCQWRRSLKWRARFFQGLPRLLADYPSSRFVFLTLTVRNCEISQLKSTLTEMNIAWKRLVQRKIWPAEGFIRSTEVTRSDDGSAHPHFHSLLQVPGAYFLEVKSKRGYLSQAEWTELWKSCLKVKYAPIVNIKAVKPRSAAKVESGMMKAICEVLKYSVKEGDLTADSEWLYELTIQLYKTRAIALGGIFKNYFAEGEPEDLIHTELDDEGEIVNKSPMVMFNWKDQVKRYLKD